MTKVTVTLMESPDIFRWDSIPVGQIFMGSGKVAPCDFPLGVASGGYGGPGPWLKPGYRCLYDFSSGAFWNPIDNQTWFEHYHPLKRVRIVEESCDPS